MSPLQSFWAKLDATAPATFHPVVCHLLDVAQVCRLLWSDVLRESLKSRFAGSLGLTHEATGAWLAFLVGAHDIGKISPGFQGKSPEGRKRLEQRGIRFPLRPEDVPHGTVSAAVLPELLRDARKWPAISHVLASRIATTVGGHHGTFPTPHECDLNSAALGNAAWGNAREDTLDVLARHFRLNHFPAPNLEAVDNAFFMLLAGLTSVADWIGSASEFFVFAGEDVNLDCYPALSEQRAREALDQLGWTGWEAIPETRSFAQLFPACNPPRPLQVAVVERAAALRGPGLVLVEAPMGEGKTEAALFLADHWTHDMGQRGMYIALPTQATSNQMFERVCEFLGHRYPADRVNVQLLHGGAILSEAYQEMLKLAAVYHDDRLSQGEDGAVVAEGWFTPKKRGLLAPFAVGTIDQALLSVLQTRHVFVRLFGLAGKTVVLDEVHAYDAYMSTLLERLLSWLEAIGCSVVLLSATLPRRKREQLLAAFGAPETSSTPGVPYPRVLVCERGRGQVVEIGVETTRRATLRLRWMEREGLIRQLAVSLEQGGCAAVLCNTVSSAQQTFRKLREGLVGSGIEISLFHARFLAADRQKIEKEVLERFGKPIENSCRPRAAILVATQVIEQSLDLDFDLMVSEVAPIDLLLQRSGRLHRHEGRRRPTSLPSPELWLLQPEEEATGVASFGASEKVYSRYILLRSLLAIRDRQTVHVPEDVETLIELVYSEEPVAEADDSWTAALKESHEKQEQEREVAEQKARSGLISSPDSEDCILDDRSRKLEEDSDEAHTTLQALTRLSEPTVRLVFLHDTPSGLKILPSDVTTIDLSAKPNLSQTKRLLEASVNLQHRAVVFPLLREVVPPGWRKNALLRNHRVLRLDPLGLGRIGDWTIANDPELGIVITRKDNTKESES